MSAWILDRARGPARGPTRRLPVALLAGLALVHPACGSEAAEGRAAAAEPGGDIPGGAVTVTSTQLGSWASFVPADPSGILVLAHGYPWPDDSRTAAQLEAHARAYVERWRPFATERGLVLVAPAFGSGDFAGYRELFGKRVDADAFVLDLVDRYGVALVEDFDGRFYLYGHSAGGQFAGRFLVQHAGRVAGVVLSAPSTYPFPDEGVAWPYGMAAAVRDTLSGTAGSEKPADRAEGALFTPDTAGWGVAASRVPVRIVIGDRDDEPRAERPGQGGNTRIDRAVAWVRAMNGLAVSRGDTGAVAIRFVPGVAHDPVALTRPAQRLLERMFQDPPTRETALDSVAWLVDPGAGEPPSVPRPDAASATTIRPVSIGGVALFVREEGVGTPLVLIPGGPGNTQQSFHPFFGRAAEFAWVIYYDPRGTGDSDWAPGPDGYSAEQAVEDLDGLRAALGIDRWVVLGWSFGGLLAQRYALRYPRRVAGLVLVSTSVPMDADVGESDGRRYMSPAERETILAVYRDGVRTVVPVHSDELDLAGTRRLVYGAYLNGEWKRQFFFRPSFERMAQVARWEWVHDRDYTTRVASSGFARDLTGAFREWTTPTLIVEGKRDPEWGPAKPRVLREQFPRAEVVVLDGASHHSFAERPARFFGLLERFISGVEAESPRSEP